LESKQIWICKAH